MDEEEDVADVATSVRESRITRKRQRTRGRVSRSSSVEGGAGVVTKLVDWHTLTKEECLARLEGLPEGLELYEATRKPRVLEGEFLPLLDKKVRLSSTGLTEDLSCPICMGIYQNVMVVKDCLHRFCEECIERWLRTGNQECPKCRKKIPSRRSLRVDPIFQRIINRLFPDVQTFENQNDKVVAAANVRKTGLNGALFLPEGNPGPRKPGRRSAKSREPLSETPVTPNEAEPTTSSTVKLSLIPASQDLEKASNLKLVVLRSLSIRQIVQVIRTGVGGGVELEVSLLKNGEKLDPNSRLSEVLEANQGLLQGSEGVTLHVRKASGK